VRVLLILPVDIRRDEPLGVMYLSAALKAAGHQTELVIAGREDPVAVARAFRPDVLAFSIITGTQKAALEINRRIRAALPGVYSVFGGPHCTFFPEFIESDGVDALCRGEGEGAMVDLAATLQAGADPTALPNWWIQRDGQVFRNPVRPLCADLDSLPYADREILAKYKHYREGRIAYFITGRGCPFECTYCFNHVYKQIYQDGGRLVRRRSVDNVLDEIAQVVAGRHIRLVRFVDDTFILSAKWVAEFAEKYRRQIGLPFQCNVRLDLVTPEIARLLKEAGCASAAAAIEAGNDHVRYEVLRRPMTREQIVAGVRAIQEQGIAISLQNILGIPGTTLAEDLETMDLNIVCDPDYAWASIYMPYPRTRLGEMAMKEGYFGGDFDEIPDRYFARSGLNLPHKTQVAYLHKLFARTVSLPWLRPLTLRLIRLPDNPLIYSLFKLVFLGWKYYRYKTRTMPGF